MYNKKGPTGKANFKTQARAENKLRRKIKIKELESKSKSVPVKDKLNG